MTPPLYPHIQVRLAPLLYCTYLQAYLRTVPGIRDLIPLGSAFHGTYLAGGVQH